MSLSMVQESVRIADKFHGARDAEAVLTRGRFENALILVFVAHMLLVVSFLNIRIATPAATKPSNTLSFCYELRPPPVEPPLELPQFKPDLHRSPKEIESPSKSGAVPITDGTAAKSKRIAAHLTTKSLNQRTPLHASNSEAPHLPREILNDSQLATVSHALPSTPNVHNNAIQPPSNGIVDDHSPSDAPASNTTGKDKIGQGGGPGKDSNDNGGREAQKPEVSPTGLWDVGPYRKRLLINIARNWHPAEPVESIVVLITVDRTGNLLDAKLVTGTGRKNLDEEALNAVRATEFESFPDEFKGKQLRFKIELSKVEIDERHSNARY